MIEGANKSDLGIDENWENIIYDAWKVMDKYKQYPIGNRGIAGFFSNELYKHINNFRKTGIKEASVFQLIENISQVFLNLKISLEYFDVNNKEYLLASIASLLSCITCYTYSKNKMAGALQLVLEHAESFALWGTGRCNNVASMMFLLLGSSTIRPIEIVGLEAPDKKSSHILLFIDKRENKSIEDIYDSDVFVIDYWSGCIGKARDLFNGPLASFKHRTIKKEVVLNESDISLNKFIFPKQAHIDEVRKITEDFYDAFKHYVSKKAFQTSSFQVDDKYDIARKNNIIEYGITSLINSFNKMDIKKEWEGLHSDRNREIIIHNAWELMDKYKRYPLGNRGMASFFSNKLCKHINNFRKTDIKEASIVQLIENIDRVFSNLKISLEYFDINNQEYLLASIASLLSDLTYYTFSKNKRGDLFQPVVHRAESFMLWGTGRSSHVACLMFLLLRDSSVRPIELVTLEAPNGKSNHTLLLINDKKIKSSDDIYNSDVLVIDYSYGCIGKAKEIFEGPLAAFRNRTIKKHIILNEDDISLDKFIFPEQLHINEVRDLVEKFYTAFKKYASTKNFNPELFFLKERYQKIVLKTDFTKKKSMYCQAGDEYDLARKDNVKKHILK